MKRKCTCIDCVFILTFQALICLIDKKSGEKSKTRPRFVKQDQVAIMRLETTGVICMELFKNYNQLGRFTLRDEGMTLISFLICSLQHKILTLNESFFIAGKTIAVGKVLKVIE